MAHSNKKFLLWAVALCLGSASAHAADMAVTASDQTWAGFHAGVNSVYTMGSSALTTHQGILGNYLNGNDGFSMTGAAVDNIGAQHAAAGNVSGALDTGYDFQWLNHLVAGLELQVNAAALNERSYKGKPYELSGPSYDPIFDFQNLRTDYGLDLRPHVGLALGKWLLDVNAGIALEHVTYTENFVDLLSVMGESVTKSEFLVAPIFGAGIHYHVTQTWIARLDFSVAQYGSTHLNNGPLVAAAPYMPLFPPINQFQGTLNHSFNLTTETVALGLDYQF